MGILSVPNNFNPELSFNDDDNYCEVISIDCDGLSINDVQSEIIKGLTTLSNTIHRLSLIGSGDTIIVNNTIYDLLMSFSQFNFGESNEIGKYLGRNIVINDNIKEDCLMLKQSERLDGNGNLIISPEVIEKPDGEMDEIVFKLEIRSSLGIDEVKELERNRIGKIKLINYEFE